MLWPTEQIRKGLNDNEIQIPYDKYHEVSSLVSTTHTILSIMKYYENVK